MVAEKKKTEAPPESRGMSKQKWIEERKKKIGKLLDANGLDMSKAYMLDTQESAEVKYKKWEKEPAPAGWDGTTDFSSKFYFRTSTPHPSTKEQRRKFKKRIFFCMITKAFKYSTK